MPQTIDPKITPRARAFELWMKSPMPMVTLTKTFDISHLVRLGRKKQTENQYAAVPLHWQGGKPNERILPAAAKG